MDTLSFRREVLFALRPAERLPVLLAGLRRGYLGRAALSAEKFLPHPLAAEAGARIYRTGDLVRFLPDGDMDFLGRLDFQVKLRGLRIELGEIESALGRHPGVREAVVVVREDRLAAYVLRAPGAEATGEALREDLRGRLPEYMLPSAFVFLEKFPLTPNGKVDRRALPAPEWQAATEYVAPRDEVEERLAAIWSEVLDVAQVGVHDDFFELGGHSLSATRLVTRIRQEFRVDLDLRGIFETPTVAALAERFSEPESRQNQDLQTIAETLEELEGLSEEEILALLEEK